MAAIVPFGIDRPGFAKSPDRFDPAIIPVQDGKNIPIKMAKLEVISADIHKFRRVSSDSRSSAVAF